MKQKCKILLALLCVCTGLLLCPISPRAAETGIDETEVTQQTPALVNVKKAPKVTGKWKKRKGQYLFKKTDGQYAANEWLNIKNKIYCFDENGYRIVGWHTYLGEKYYFATNGVMVMNWKKIGRSMFFFRRNGTMITSEWKKSGGKYYYLKEKGRMATGWLTLGKRKYYMDETGVRVTGDYFIGDRGYHFNSKGVYQPGVEVESVNPNKPMIALTFDDGPGPYTERLLNCLQKYHAAATFFVVGRSVGNYESTVKRAYDMGCEIGNHSWDHPKFTSIGVDGITSQISATNQAVRKATGHDTTLLRPPYGAYNSTVASAAGMPLILWEVDTLDWKTRNVQSTINSVLGSSQDGSIVLMHDIHEPTVAAVETIVPELLKRGYQLVTVSDLEKYKKQPLLSGVAYRFIR